MNPFGTYRACPVKRGPSASCESQRQRKFARVDGTDLSTWFLARHIVQKQRTAPRAACHMRAIPNWFPLASQQSVTTIFRSTVLRTSPLILLKVRERYSRHDHLPTETMLLLMPRRRHCELSARSWNHSRWVSRNRHRVFLPEWNFEIAGASWQTSVELVMDT